MFASEAATTAIFAATDLGVRVARPAVILQWEVTGETHMFVGLRNFVR